MCMVCFLQNIEKALWQAYLSPSFLLCGLHFPKDNRLLVENSESKAMPLTYAKLYLGDDSEITNVRMSWTAKKEGEFEQSLVNMGENVNEYGPGELRLWDTL